MRSKPKSCEGCQLHSHGTDFSQIEGTGANKIVLVLSILVEYNPSMNLGKLYVNLSHASPDGKRTIGQDVDAYLAGFFDGEGCISVYTYGRNSQDGCYRACVKIMATNTDINPLALLERVYGGVVRSKGKPIKETHKQCYNWVAQGKDAHWALARMLPWLRVKNRKARAAIAIIQATPPRGSMQSKYQKAVVVRSMGLFKVIKKYKRHELVSH